MAVMAMGYDNDARHGRSQVSVRSQGVQRRGEHEAFLKYGPQAIDFPIDINIYMNQ